MARFAILECGVAANFAEADADYALGKGWVLAPTARIGDVWDGSEWNALAEPSPPVPESVTMRAARRALLDAGLLSQVGAAIAGMPSPERERAMIDWEYAQTVERHSPFVASLAPVLGLDETQLDQLFLAAAALSP